MIKGSPDAGRGQVPVIYLVPFLLIAFGLTWGLMALFLLFPKQITEVRFCGSGTTTIMFRVVFFCGIGKCGG
jgi:hypothetical protein